MNKDQKREALDWLVNDTDPANYIVVDFEGGIGSGNEVEAQDPTPQKNPHQVSSPLQPSELPLPHHIRSLTWKVLRHRLVF